MCSVPIWLENRTYFLPESSQFALPSSQGAVGQANEVLIPFLTKWNWLDEIKPHKFDILNLVNQTSRFKIRFIISSSRSIGLFLIYFESFSYNGVCSDRLLSNYDVIVLQREKFHFTLSSL